MPISPSYDQHQQAALDALERYNKQLDQIRLNGQLSHAGKQNAIGALWGRTVKEQQAQQNAAATDHQRNLSALEREVYGLKPGATPAELALYRSAVEQAATISDPPTALAHLKSAALSGDTMLAKTILAQAIQSAHAVPIPAMAAPWADVANAYIELNPDAEASVEALWEASPQSAGGIVQNMAFHAPEKPTEVLGLSDPELLALAE